jgi:hypothetical protein
LAHRVVKGAGFLPHHKVTVRVTYTADDINDYINYATDSRGTLHAQLPTSATTGSLRIAATDHRIDPDGSCGLLWSNTETVRPCDE